MFPKHIRLVDEKVLEVVRGQGCCICGKTPVDPSHIRSRGAGGPDTLWNVVAHCRQHHSEWHSRGWKDFIRRHSHMGVILTRLGWKLNDGDLWHPGLIVKSFDPDKVEVSVGGTKIKPVEEPEVKYEPPPPKKRRSTVSV